jgi:hypothetical protein
MLTYRSLAFLQLFPFAAQTEGDAETPKSEKKKEKKSKKADA